MNIVSLGCPRNLVDSEVMLGALQDAGYGISEEASGTDVVIVNTCAFIEDAKKESVDVVLQLIDLKKKGLIGRLLVSGCLAQRYSGELKEELKEVDAFVGVGEIRDIVDVVRRSSGNERVVKVKKNPGFLYDHKSPRLLITPAHYAYIKIQEGCVNRCSYCVIPRLRGDYRSRTVESVLKEASSLLKSVSEINLIGQDTTLYGRDLYDKPALPELLRRISELPEREAWIRLLYTHPAHFTDELIDAIRGYPVCKYVDLPVQHINETILTRMNRHVKRGRILSLIEKLRKSIPSLTLRTSVIVGFPGETEAQFEELISFIKETRFERLGAFVYSREEGTPAFDFKGQLPEKVKKERLDRIMKLQQSISESINAGSLGRVVRVLVDKRLEGEDNLFLARTEADAPEVDGSVYLTASGIDAGSFVNARITGTLEYDLVGEQV